MPLDVLAQLEGVSQAVFRNLPGCGYTRDDVPLRVIIDEPIEGHTLELYPSRCCNRVHEIWIVVDHDQSPTIFRLPPSHPGAFQGGNQPQHQREKHHPPGLCYMHVSSLLMISSALLVYLIRVSSISASSRSLNALVTSARRRSTKKARYRSKSSLMTWRGRGISMQTLSRSRPGRAVRMITRSAR